MASASIPSPVHEIESELASARASFHSLLDSLSDEDWARRSHNPGWTNGEIVFHMAFAFMLLQGLVPMVRIWGRLPKACSKAFAGSLNAATALFNWVNGLGPRGGARLYNRDRIGRKYDSVHASLLRTLAGVKQDEWGRGMYYPDRWDGLFEEYMTLEKVFRYPTVHLRFHLKQINGGA